MSTEDSTTALDRRLRILAAMGSFASAIVHLWLYVDSWSAIPVVGPLFLMNAIAGTLIAIGLIIQAGPAWLSPTWLLAAFGFNGLSAIALLLAHTDTGFFGVREMYWDAWQILSLVAEVTGFLAAGWGLVRWWQVRSRAAEDPTAS